MMESTLSSALPTPSCPRCHEITAFAENLDRKARCYHAKGVAADKEIVKLRAELASRIAGYNNIIDLLKVTETTLDVEKRVGRETQELRDTVTGLEGRCQELEKANNELQQQNTAATATISDLQGANTNLNTKCADLERRLAISQAACSAISNTFAQHGGAVARIFQSLEAVTTEAQKLLPQGKKSGWACLRS